MTLQPGTRIGNVELVELVATGGQGQLWRAKDGATTVAVKVVRRGPRFEAEWARLRRLDHPSVVRPLGIVEVDDVHAGIVMRWVDGRPLDEAALDARWTRDLSKLALRHLLHALVYVHAREIVHRDVKPANVLVTAGFFDDPENTSTIVLVDFGIAAPLRNPTPVTEAGMRVGTARYLAPETFLDPQTTVEATRDVFALGVVGWELMTGVHPLGEPPQEVDRWIWYAAEYRRALDGARGFPEGHAGSLDHELRSCLRLSPRDRPANANRVLDVSTTSPPTPSVEQAMPRRRQVTTENVPVVAPPTLVTVAGAKRPRRALLAVLGVALLVGVGFAAVSMRPADSNCHDVGGIVVDPPSHGQAMTMRSAPNERDKKAIIVDLPRGTIVERLDRDPATPRGEDWFHVRVVCSSASMATGREGYVHAVGFPALLPRRTMQRATDIAFGWDEHRHATLDPGTRVGVISVAPAPRVYVRVIDGPEADNAGYIAPGDLPP